MNVEGCTRCGATIARNPHGGGPYDRFDIVRHVGEGGWDSATVELCTMCLDDMWEWAFESDVDRSDKADPMPLERMAESVRRHIEQLESVLDEIAEAKT